MDFRRLMIQSNTSDLSLSLSPRNANDTLVHQGQNEVRQDTTRAGEEC